MIACLPRWRLRLLLTWSRPVTRGSCRALEYEIEVRPGTSPLRPATSYQLAPVLLLLQCNIRRTLDSPDIMTVL